MELQMQTPALIGHQVVLLPVLKDVLFIQIKTGQAMELKVIASIQTDCIAFNSNKKVVVKPFLPCDCLAELAFSAESLDLRIERKYDRYFKSCLVHIHFNCCDLNSWTGHALCVSPIQ